MNPQIKEEPKVKTVTVTEKSNWAKVAVGITSLFINTTLGTIGASMATGVPISAAWKLGLVTGGIAVTNHFMKSASVGKVLEVEGDGYVSKGLGPKVSGLE